MNLFFLKSDSTAFKWFINSIDNSIETVRVRALKIKTTRLRDNQNEPFDVNQIINLIIDDLLNHGIIIFVHIFYNWHFLEKTYLSFSDDSQIPNHLISSRLILNPIAGSQYNSFNRSLLQLRGGSTFGPVKFVKEVSHVKHMHTNSLLVHPNFSSKLMIT